MTLKAHSPAQRKAMLAEAIRRHHAGDLAAAEVLYRGILEAEPDNFEAVHMLAVIGNQSDQLADSIALFERAEKLQPYNPALLVNYGATLRKAKRFEEALVVYDRALDRQPTLPEALYNKAQCLMVLERPAEAAEFYRRSLAVKPGHVDSMASLGNAMLALGRWDEAVSHFEHALALNPNFVPALIDLAMAFRNKEWFSSARLLLERAVAAEPRHAAARSQLSLLLLTMGDLEAGWKSYEGRFWYLDQKVPRRPVPPMYWDGEDLSGKSIVVWTEQGIGDEILYSTMLPDVIERAAHVYVACDGRMIPVYRQSFGPHVTVCDFHDLGRLLAQTKIDYQIAIASLGRILRPAMSSFPRRPGHLRADPAKVAEFKAKYGPGPVVGLSWRSGAPLLGNKKSTRLSDWGAILKQAGVTFVSLQYGDTKEDVAEAKAKFDVDIVVDETINQHKNMESFFAQAAAMDLIISTSNTAVHVAGAINQATWVMLPRGAGAHWYWFQGRSDNPFYPSLRLFRQDSKGEWGPVIDEVGKAFAAWLAQRAIGR